MVYRPAIAWPGTKLFGALSLCLGQCRGRSDFSLCEIIPIRYRGLAIEEIPNGQNVDRLLFLGSVRFYSKDPGGPSLSGQRDDFAACSSSSLPQ